MPCHFKGCTYTKYSYIYFFSHLVSNKAYQFIYIGINKIPKSISSGYNETEEKIVAELLQFRIKMFYNMT